MLLKLLKLLKLITHKLKLYLKIGEDHCVRSARIRSFSGGYFPAFGLNTERHGVSLHIQFKCGKIWNRKTPNTNTFYAVDVLKEAGKFSIFAENL